MDWSIKPSLIIHLLILCVATHPVAGNENQASLRNPPANPLNPQDLVHRLQARRGVATTQESTVRPASRRLAAPALTNDRLLKRANPPKGMAGSSLAGPARSRGGAAANTQKANPPVRDLIATGQKRAQVFGKHSTPPAHNIIANGRARAQVFENHGTQAALRKETGATAAPAQSNANSVTEMKSGGRKQRTNSVSQSQSLSSNNNNQPQQQQQQQQQQRQQPAPPYAPTPSLSWLPRYQLTPADQALLARPLPPRPPPSSWYPSINHSQGSTSPLGQGSVGAGVWQQTFNAAQAQDPANGGSEPEKLDTGYYPPTPMHHGFRASRM